MYRSLGEAMRAGRLTPASARRGRWTGARSSRRTSRTTRPRSSRGPPRAIACSTTDGRVCASSTAIVGEPMLPATCGHFPRLAVRDARGTFVSLSHFCPTAAATLFREDVLLEIVEHPQAFPERGLRRSDRQRRRLAAAAAPDHAGRPRGLRRVGASHGVARAPSRARRRGRDRDARPRCRASVRSVRSGEGDSIAGAIAALPVSVRGRARRRAHSMKAWSVTPK